MLFPHLPEPAKSHLDFVASLTLRLPDLGFLLDFWDSINEDIDFFVVKTSQAGYAGGFRSRILVPPNDILVFLAIDDCGKIAGKPFVGTSVHVIVVNSHPANAISTKCYNSMTKKASDCRED